MVEPSEELMASDLCLQFMTHEARGIVKKADLVGLKLYDQVRLIAWCYNYSHKRVLSVVLDERKKCGDVTSRAIMDHAANGAHPPYPRRRAQLSFGDIYRDAQFSVKAVKNLYCVDRFMLYGDYSSMTRIEDLASALSFLEYESLKDLAGEMGFRSMGFVVMKLEELMAMKRREREETAKMISQEFDFGQPMSEEDRQKMREVLDEIRLVRRKQEGK